VREPRKTLKKKAMPDRMGEKKNHIKKKKRNKI